MTRLHKYWDDLRSSLWFIPALIVAAAVALAVGLIEVEAFGNRELLAERWPRMFGAGAEGSRGLLSTIAGSMITVAGVTFSITVIALTLASSQYTSRILRNFVRDRGNQTVLGVFVGVFAYGGATPSVNRPTSWRRQPRAACPWPTIARRFRRPVLCMTERQRSTRVSEVGKAPTIRRQSRLVDGGYTTV